VNHRKGETVTYSLRYKINVPHIVHEIFDDQEAAIINLKSGNYYSLNPIGTYIWAQIEPSTTMGEIVEEIVSRYEGNLGEIINEVTLFIDQLYAEELIVTANDASGETSSRHVKIGPDGNDSKSAFSPPLLERYNDMQELLLLDPIHEVAETGWPHRKPEE
jgi:Coenzyme PQQ synthesis protein D (PqqD)